MVRNRQQDILCTATMLLFSFGFFFVLIWGCQFCIAYNTPLKLKISYKKIGAYVNFSSLFFPLPLLLFQWICRFISLVTHCYCLFSLNSYHMPHIWMIYFLVRLVFSRFPLVIMVNNFEYVVWFAFYWNAFSRVWFVHFLFIFLFVYHLGFFFLRIRW